MWMSEWSSGHQLNTWRADAVNFPRNVEAGSTVLAEIPICCTRGAVLTWKTAEFSQRGTAQVLCSLFGGFFGGDLSRVMWLCRPFWRWMYLHWTEINEGRLSLSHNQRFCICLLVCFFPLWYESISDHVPALFLMSGPTTVLISAFSGSHKQTNRDVAITKPHCNK